MLSKTEAFKNIREGLKRFDFLSASDWELFLSAFEQKAFKKGDEFIQTGQVCNHIGFLNSGIARVYYLVEGREITSYFNTGSRNVFVGSFTSFLSRRPSFETVHFLEDSELLLLDYDALQKLYNASPNIQKLGRLMAEHNYVLSMERIYSLQHSPAIDRYNSMLKVYPGLMNQVPHHYVASYLGITPESLSRIRKEAVKQKK